jgi:hypothetical protein
MAGERPKPLTTGEAKAALIDWGRSVDRSLGGVFRRHRTGFLVGAFALGVGWAWFGGRKSKRRRARG